jgi:tetratricopeptide (TPR) repeat protein
VEARDRGILLQHSFKFPEALEAYNEAIKRNPLDPIPYFLSGECHFSLNNFVESQKMFEMCVERDGKNSKAHFHLGECLLKNKQDFRGIKEMRLALSLEPNSEFKVILDQVLELKDQEAKTLMVGSKEWYVADITVYLDKNLTAAQMFQQTGNRAGEEKALGFIAAAYTSLKDFPHAIHYYAECLKINRELKDLEGEALQWNNIGTLYYTQGDFEEAMKNFERAFEIQKKLDKFDEAIMRNISMMSAFLEKWERTIEVCELVLTKNPKDLNALYGLAQALSRIGNIQKSMEIYTKSLEIAKTVRVYNDLGVLHETLSEFDKALEFFELAVNLSKEDKNEHGLMLALNNLGSCYFKMKKYDLALEKLKETQELAIKLDHKPVLQAVAKSLELVKKEMKN